MSYKANAATYEISVRQLNPDRWTYSEKCSDEKGFCRLFMGVSPQNETYRTDDIELEVGIFFMQGGAYFQFRSGRRYFFVSEKKDYLEIPLNRKEIKSKTRIYLHHPSMEEDPQGLYNFLVIRPPSKMVAELEITIDRRSE